VLDRRFDMIDSRVVLHHLADPAAGWRVLLSLLRPSGLMAVGLYSELARGDVVAGRAFCAERGYPPTQRGIREARQALLSGEFRSFEQFNDFFSVSECRDMLFHVEEHRFTIAEIEALLGALGLRLIGFELPGPVAAAYRQRFPDDPGMLRLDYWDRFESERPRTFAAMYQFWAQKA
jgi:SAM-dependent methyltransferase